MTYSVGMCTYNGAKYVAEQLNSILAQTVLPDEIVISDDGSTDDTVAIMGSILSKSTVPYHIYTDNADHGVVGNFWYVFSKCSGDLIFSCDQDDVWLPNKAETILRIFGENEKAQLVFSDAVLIDKDSNSLQMTLFGTRPKVPGMTSPSFDWLSFLLHTFWVTGATMAFRSNLFAVEEKPVGYLLHDAFLALKAASLRGVMACEDALTLYRQHDNNVVGAQKTSKIKKCCQTLRRTHQTRIGQQTAWQQIKTLFGTQMNDAQNAYLSAKIEFWSQQLLTEQKNVLCRVKTTRTLYKQGAYNNFYGGKFYYFCDLLYALKPQRRDTK